MIPAYGQRQGWVPRSLQDFSDGGAFPEINVPQYPLNMGKKETKSLVKVDLKNYLPAKQLSPDSLDLDKLTKPSEEEVRESAERAKAALEAITKSKISAALPVRVAEQTAPAQYIRYKSEQGDTQRLIRMVEVQKDPLEPPKFKINKKIPQAPPSPPPAVMHSPTRKVSVKEQNEWKIPPCISNWKNRGGYVIPLDKRLAADGRGIQQNHINEKFAKLAEALYVAERKAREGVEMRAQMEKKQLQKEKEKKEADLKKLAQKAREERAGLKSDAKKYNEDVKERDEIRHEKHRERQRDRNIQRAAPKKRSEYERQRERDISEKIALGLANPGTTSSELQFDTRLLNQSKGISSGFGDEDDYAVYDKPWRSSAELGKSIYRPRNISEDNADDLDKLANTAKFVQDKGFEGTSVKNQRDGPVNFEKVKPEEEDDPFGIDTFLRQAKTYANSKRKDDSSHEGGGSHRKRR